MADRRRQIELLIATRFDLLWFPSGQTFDKAAATSKAGRRPSRLKPCSRCDETGSVLDRFSRLQPCPECAGVGHIPWDDYTNEPVAEVSSSDEPWTAEQWRQALERDTRRVKCPDCQDLAGNATGVVHGRPCPRCQGTGEAAVAGSWLSTPRDSVLDDVHAPLEAAIDRRNHAGSYHDLDVALAGISRHANKPLRFAGLTVHATLARRLLDEVYLTHERELRELSRFEQSLVELALAYIDLRMPSPIRVPAGVEANEQARLEQLRLAKGRATDERARRVRDEQARRWAREGRPYPWIRQQLGLSERQLREILNRKERAA